MQAYGDLFAKVYNRLWQSYANKIAPLIREYYETTAVGNYQRSLLDLCCGTGQLAVYFLEHGYQVVGLDLSPGMLKFARENALPFLTAEQVRFIRGDASDFSIEETFGLVVSTFDAVNHLQDENALRGCFESTIDVLVDDGYFIFDLNTRKGLSNWNRMTIDPDDDIFLFNRGLFDPSMEKGWTRITGFIQDENGLYTRFDETVYNTVFEMKTVKGILVDCGFREVYFARITNLADPIATPESESKVFVIAQK
jgi:SAM-dependent methyltransferase